MYQKVQYFTVQSRERLLDILGEIDTMFLMEANGVLPLTDRQLEGLTTEREMVVARLYQLFAYYTGLDQSM